MTGLFAEFTPFSEVDYNPYYPTYLVAVDGATPQSIYASAVTGLRGEKASVTVEVPRLEHLNVGTIPAYLTSDIHHDAAYLPADI